MNGNNCNELAGIRCLMERTNLIKKIIIMEFTNTNHSPKLAMIEKEE